MTHKILDLFSGVGGFSLGLERTGGFDTVAFCEIDKKAQLVLKKHWPGVPIFDDIQKLNVDQLDKLEIKPDVIVGGFPCQDISVAGEGAGLEGKRSGLWSEYARLISEIRPRYAIVENVSALLVRGVDRVLGELAEIGYDAEWHCIPASAVGAPHRRDRIWIMAYPNCTQRERGGVSSGISQEYAIIDSGSADGNPSKNVADTASNGREGGGINSKGIRTPKGTVEGSSILADPERQRQPRQGASWDGFGSTPTILGEATKPLDGSFKQVWSVEPTLGRVANGVPNRMDRLKQLGNAVVPQIPQLIGQAILDYENQIESERDEAR